MLKWSVDQAQIVDCGSFPDKETNEVRAWAKLAFFGGLVSLDVTPDDLRKLSPHKGGGMIAVNGTLLYEIKKGSGAQTMRFCVSEVKPIK